MGIKMISVVIPAYNTEKTLANAIKALLKQSYPKNKYEIIVVDDGSSDKTFETASKFPITVIKQNHGGPASARNVGAEKSKGDIILFTDSDCVPDKNWIKEMVEPFKNPEIVGVSGTYKTLNKNKFMARFNGYEISQRHENMKKHKFIDFIGTFSAGYRRDIFLKFGGFDTRFKMSSGEDTELSYRIAKAGLKMVFQPHAFVYHPHTDSLWNYLKQKYQRAVWRNLLYWSGHREKILTDSYTHPMLFPQAFLSGITPLIFLILILFDYSIIYAFISVISILFFIALIFNLDLILFLWKKEKKVALLSPLILLLRNIFGIIGVLVGLSRYLTKKYRV